MASALSTLSFSFAFNPTWTAKVSVTGLSGAIQNQNNLNKTISLSTSASDAAANGASQLYYAQVTLAGAASTTIDLSSFTDIVGRTAQSMARIKAFYFRLLNSTDDSSITTTPSSFSVGNAAANAHALGLSVATTTRDFVPGDSQGWATQSAAGLVVDGTHKNIKILNNDASVTGYMDVLIVGGYA